MIGVLGAEKLSLVEIEEFLAASESVRFAGSGRMAIFAPALTDLSMHASYVRILSSGTSSQSPARKTAQRRE